MGKMLKSFNVKVFYMMGKALSGELSCPCDSSCLYRYTSMFSCHFTKKDNFCDFLFASLHKVAF